MENNKPKFGQRIPELTECILKYGCAISDNPPYVIVGQYKSEQVGLVAGIIAAAKNEFHAHILRREARKNGMCEIEETEFHPSGNGTFSVSEHKQRIRERLQKKEIR